MFVGNGYCDDGLNTAECNFDAGDCCDPSANTDYCSICQCLSGQNGTTPSTQTSSGTTGLSFLVLIVSVCLDIMNQLQMVRNDL